jgi:hypothetical protein
MSPESWKTARRWVLTGFDRLLLLFGWFSLLAAAFLLCLSMLWHSSLSPFQHPGGRPDAGPILLLTSEAIRWAFTAAAGCATAMLRGPAWRKRMNEFVFIAWMMRPVVVLVGSMAMLAVTAVLWFLWMGRLPTGDRFGNGLLAALYFLLPMAQLAVTAAYLADDPEERFRSRPPGPPPPGPPSGSRGRPLPPRNAGSRPPARKRTG